MESKSDNSGGTSVAQKSNSGGDEYETVIPAEAEAEFIDEDSVKVVEEVIEVSNITRGLLAETVLGTVSSIMFSMTILKILYIVYTCTVLTKLIAYMTFFK